MISFADPGRTSAHGPSARGLWTCLCLLSAAALLPLPVQTQATFSSSANTVAIYATVVDGSGRLVTGLTAADFEVKDDGKQQTLTQFEAGTLPITIVMMLDDSPSLRASRSTTQAAATAFIRELRAGDRATLGMFSRTVRIEGSLTGDQVELLARLQASIPPMAGTALWDALAASLAVLDDESGRRVVLLLTDGDDNSSDTDPAAITTRALRDGVMFYAVGIRGSEGRLSKHVGDLARETGGWFFELKGSEDLSAVFQRVANELHRQYLLGFAITSLDGKQHKLEVKLRSPGLHARTRQSYFAPLAKAKSPIVALDSR